MAFLAGFLGGFLGIGGGLVMGPVLLELGLLPEVLAGLGLSGARVRMAGR